MWTSGSPTRDRWRRCGCEWRSASVFEAGTGRDKRSAPIAAVAEAELAPLGADAGLTEFAAGGGYSGPLAHRQGKPMRPDVALAFDRMEAGARADGVALLINSGFGSDAEQAILFARHPDPKWVARPGTSLHRSGTELDLGPPAAYPWLKANASRFHFVRGTRGRTGTTRRRNAISHSGAVPTSAMWRGSQDCGDPWLAPCARIDRRGHGETFAGGSTPARALRPRIWRSSGPRLGDGALVRLDAHRSGVVGWRRPCRDHSGARVRSQADRARVELAVVMLTTLFSNALGIRLTSTTDHGGAYGD
jgi:hypothetical protein